MLLPVFALLALQFLGRILFHSQDLVQQPKAKATIPSPCSFISLLSHCLPYDHSDLKVCSHPIVPKPLKLTNPQKCTPRQSDRES